MLLMFVIVIMCMLCTYPAIIHTLSIFVLPHGLCAIPAHLHSRLTCRESGSCNVGCAR